VPMAHPSLSWAFACKSQRPVTRSVGWICQPGLIFRVSMRTAASLISRRCCPRDAAHDRSLRRHARPQRTPGCCQARQPMRGRPGRRRAALSLRAVNGPDGQHDSRTQP